jgi:hypothetical protein
VDESFGVAAAQQGVEARSRALGDVVEEAQGIFVPGGEGFAVAQQMVHGGLLFWMLRCFLQKTYKSVLTLRVARNYA